jgi:hypothetical protein
MIVLTRRKDCRCRITSSDGPSDRSDGALVQATPPNNFDKRTILAVTISFANIKGQPMDCGRGALLPRFVGDRLRANKLF